VHDVLELGMSGHKAFSVLRHCEERSDEAIQNVSAALDCFPLATGVAMTAWDIVGLTSAPAKAGQAENKRRCLTS
jgi:hypothetical protein